MKSVNHGWLHVRRLLRAPLGALGICLALLLLGAGCASDPPPRAGLPAPATMRVEPVSVEGTPGRRVVTDHYHIHTTIEDADFVASLAQLMEGALHQYRRLVPEVRPSSRAMQCYVFADRTQWAAFTRASAGRDAAVYLQINRGGYTQRDVYAAYYIGDVGTWCVAAHEGWHQFVARHFRRRPPPFLEEGLACLFEDVKWSPGPQPLPTWDLTVNPGRLNGLANALDHGHLIPLTDACSMHAGQVVNTTRDQVEAFYAQGWAFARFLWDGENGRYRAGLQQMLSDLAAGNASAGLGHSTADGTWDPRSARPLLEHYLKADLAEVDVQFRSYANEIVGRGKGARSNSGQSR